MGKFDAHKLPFQYRMGAWAQNKTNNALEKVAKSIPCHVTEVAKDFIKVAFETANGIFTMPIVKIPQQFSQFSREPTQKGNKGYAVPGNYYLGGVTGDAGGNTNFYPRGNLTTLAFNPVSHTQNRERNYDQLTHMGGPDGWSIGAFTKQAGDNDGSGDSGGGSGGGGGSVAAASSPIVAFSSVGRSPRSITPIRIANPSRLAVTPKVVQDYSNNRARRMAIQLAMLKKSNPVMAVAAMSASVAPLAAGSNGGGGGSSSGGGGDGQTQQPSDKTTYNFDKNGMCTIQSKDTDHNITVNQAAAEKITLNIPVGEWGYVGGDGKKGKYARIMTESGPLLNFKGRIA